MFGPLCAQVSVIFDGTLASCPPNRGAFCATVRSSSIFDDRMANLVFSDCYPREASQQGPLLGRPGCGSCCKAATSTSGTLSASIARCRRTEDREGARLH